MNKPSSSRKARKAVRGGDLLSDRWPTVPCRCCKATGRLPISHELYTLLVTLREARQPLTTADMPQEGIGATGVNNRLEALEAAGLVVRVGKRSKFHLWAACSESDKALAQPGRKETL